MSVVKQLLDENDNSSLKQYMDNLLESVSNTNMYSNTNNVCIDNVINYKLRKAHDMGISIQCDTTVPHNIELPMVDMTSLLGNLLDNAITGTLKASDRRIKIHIQYNKHSLIGVIENTYDGNLNYKDGILITLKQDTKHHGLGLKNVKKVIEKYNGILKIEHTDTDFILKFVIDI